MRGLRASRIDQESVYAEPHDSVRQYTAKPWYHFLVISTSLKRGGGNERSTRRVLTEVVSTRKGLKWKRSSTSSQASRLILSRRRCICCASSIASFAAAGARARLFIELFQTRLACLGSCNHFKRAYHDPAAAYGAEVGLFGIGLGLRCWGVYIGKSNDMGEIGHTCSIRE